MSDLSLPSLTKFTDNRFMSGWTSMLQFSWNSTMLQTDVMHCSYVTW